MVERRERRRLRELGVRALYQAEVVGEDVQDALANVLDHARKISEPGGAYLKQVLWAFETHSAVIDAALDAQAEHWSLKRMAATDRNVLRWAAAELWYRPDVPRAVVLDEAIELAKELSGPESGKFVNGILDRLPAEPPPEPAPGDAPPGFWPPGMPPPWPPMAGAFLPSRSITRFMAALSDFSGSACDTGRDFRAACASASEMSFESALSFLKLRLSMVMPNLFNMRCTHSCSHQ